MGLPGGDAIIRSGIPARIALRCDALPDFFFVVVRHEYPFSNLDYSASASPTYIVEGSRTDSDARCVGASWRSRIHGGAAGSENYKKRHGGPKAAERVNQTDLQTMRCAGSSRQASGLASSWADSFAWPTFISSGNGTPFFTAVISARMEMAISEGVLLPM